ncbi:ribbon-helix-helix domain-containing protein [Nitrosospira sp. Is2]|uniref:ribbon-helix-helix domain-containing protein n=1 Tax=Nitrosospira sp. Is2 TaxID=3080532 RepID=UPI00295410F6|nr:ribbon-helix-helix domain-containing protein [Nitrosospira sp. Is2]WON74198.1 ribbon-helix-helix domain-containing protein [Nitrosospira sp. Is2]
MSTSSKPVRSKQRMPEETIPVGKPANNRRERLKGTVMIGGQYLPQVRSALLLVQAQPQNVGRTLQDLLGEAINDVCAKYNIAQPYHSQTLNNLCIPPPPLPSRSAVPMRCRRKK